jgi:hypothetical protein
MRLFIDQRAFHLQGEGALAVRPGEYLNRLARHVVEEGLVFPCAKIRQLNAESASGREGF